MQLPIAHIPETEKQSATIDYGIKPRKLKDRQMAR